VTVTFTIDTSKLTVPPYIIKEASTRIDYSDGSYLTYPGWGTQRINNPKSGGAPFTIVVVDLGFSSTNQTDVAQWAMTFIPRRPTTAESPFSNKKNTIAGEGTSAASNGTFTLDFRKDDPSIKKQTGSWDWSLMVQMALPSGVLMCLVSDPEMDVNPIMVM
jgi:hypothetical protein